MCIRDRSRFRRMFPDRFFDVGIAEEHAVTFAAGLAAGGMKPVFAVYSSFLQRGYDQDVYKRQAVDIGLPQLAMHSAYETAGARDCAYMIRAVKAFFESGIREYTIRR